MVAQIRKVLVPWLDKHFEDQVIDVAILETFWKLWYDHPTQDQAQTVRIFVLGSNVFVMLPTESGKSSCYSSLPNFFDILQQSAGQVQWMLLPHTQTTAMLNRTAVCYAQLTYLCFTMAGHNNYFLQAQESSPALPDRFFIGYPNWSQDYHSWGAGFCWEDGHVPYRYLTWDPNGIVRPHVTVNQWQGQCWLLLAQGSISLGVWSSAGIQFLWVVQNGPALASREAWSNNGSPLSIFKNSITTLQQKIFYSCVRVFQL